MQLYPRRFSTWIPEEPDQVVISLLNDAPVTRKKLFCVYGCMAVIRSGSRSLAFLAVF